MIKKLAVAGATGLVGREILAVLEEQETAAQEIHLYASGRSAGDTILFQGKNITVENIQDADFRKTDILLSCLSPELSRQVIPKAVSHGAIVVDNSSAFRMDPNVPLVVPQINASCLNKHQGIIANPNCTTIQLAMVLAPLHAAYGLKRVVVSTYQAVSGAGRQAMQELMQQCTALLSGRPVNIKEFPHQMAFNVLPHIGDFDATGYTSEERKVIQETRKILDAPELSITATSVRVPVVNSHCESVYVTLNQTFEPKDIRSILQSAEGVIIQDQPEKGIYPMPLDANGTDDVFVGRIRQDLDDPCSGHLWLVTDNLRKGAALNAVQIAQHLAKRA